MLKAFLVDRGAPLERTHDLAWLLDLCITHEPSLEALRDPVKPVSAFAVAFRYPGPAEPTAEQVAGALGVVRQVWDAVTSRLSPAAVPEV